MILFAMKKHLVVDLICKSQGSTCFTVSRFKKFVSLTFIQFQPLTSQGSFADQEVPNEALKQVLLAIEEDPFSSKQICSTYIKTVCHSGNLSDVLQLLRVLKSKNMSLDLDAYNDLLTSAALTKNFQLSSWIFKDLLLTEKYLSFGFYMNVAKAFEKTDCSILLNFIREVSELTFSQCTTPVNRLLLAFAETGNIEKVLFIFENMKDPLCKRDLITYNTVLAILGRAGQLEQMLHDFIVMKESGCVPDLVTYNTLINSFQKMGRMDLCLNITKEMCEKDIKADLRTYTALIDGFGRLGNMEEALRLFNEMKRQKVRPSVYVYRSIISNLKKIDKLDLANMFMEELKSDENKLIGPKDFKRKNR